MRSNSNSKRIRRKQNRRKPGKDPILMVNARILEHRKEKAHRVGGILLFTVAIGGIIWAVTIGTRVMGQHLFSANDQFRVEEIEINADGLLKPWHIKEYAKIKEGMNLFEVDLDDVRNNLESVPLIKDVTVRRKLPDTLSIRVTERRALARIGSRRQSYHLSVDGEGYVLGPSARSARLPSVVGFKKSGLRPGSYIGNAAFKDGLRVLEVCESARLGDAFEIDQIDVSHPDYLLLELNGDIEVYLSRRDVEFRLRQLEQVVSESKASGRQPERVDLTGDGNNIPVKYR